MKKLAVILLIQILVAGVALAQAPVEVHPNQLELLESDDPELAANKKLVFDFWREVFQARNMELAPTYMAENYIQHNPNVPSGREAFVNFFGQFEQLPVKDTIDDLVTIRAEGDMVILAFKREYPDPQNEGEIYTTTWFDMLRIENGKLAEHWDFGTISGE